MWRTVWLLSALGPLLWCALPDVAVQGEVWAVRVVDYTPGSGIQQQWGTGLMYSNPLAALNGPSGLTGETYAGWPNVLSPFSPAYEVDEAVQIGDGGSLTLQLAAFALPDGTPAPELGVITNVGLMDSGWPNGIPAFPAVVFGADEAIVSVSADGAHFVALNNGEPIRFELPAVYYLDAGPYDTSPGTVVADFGKPFTPAGGLNAFNGLASYSDVLAVFAGSGGGTWLDLDQAGLPQVGYVRFEDPADGDPFEVDAVVVANSAVGAAVPEPPAGLLAVCAFAAWAAICTLPRGGAAYLKAALRGRRGVIRF